jgi:hypothetical protein
MESSVGKKAGNKATGVDELPIELIKAADAPITALTELLLYTGLVPVETISWMLLSAGDEARTLVRTQR